MTIGEPTFEILLRSEKIIGVLVPDATVACELPDGRRAGCSLMALLDDFGKTANDADVIVLAAMLERAAENLHRRVESADEARRLTQSIQGKLPARSDL